ncbi:large-conductance mechanosensitive channel [Globomyces pollinis-pini]|nr:large-conductance mechanosensitive channel [Globomyces pollinis-pini]
MKKQPSIEEINLIKKSTVEKKPKSANKWFSCFRMNKPSKVGIETLPNKDIEAGTILENDEKEGKKEESKPFNIFEDFQKFIASGNTIELAVGIIIGGAFGSIIDSVVNDLLTPIIGLIIGTSLSGNFAVLKCPDENPCSSRDYTTVSLAETAGAITFNYGTFFQTIINFLFIALVLYIIIKGYVAVFMNDQGETEESKPECKPCPFCLLEIPIIAKKCPNCTSDTGFLQVDQKSKVVSKRDTKGKSELENSNEGRKLEPLKS